MRAATATSEACADHQESLSQLYALYRAGRLGDMDPRWTRVQDMLMEFSRGVVVRFATNLFGQTREHRVEDVYGRLLVKFLKKSFHPHGPNLEPLLLHTARNDLTTSFRRSQSPTPVYYDGAESTWEDQSSQWEDGSADVGGRCHEDLFSSARTIMRPFRFREYGHARDGMLAFFLTHFRHPGQIFLHTFGVHRTVRPTVYNAAVVDINQAMIDLRSDH